MNFLFVLPTPARSIHAILGGPHGTVIPDYHHPEYLPLYVDTRDPTSESSGPASLSHLDGFSYALLQVAHLADSNVIKTSIAMFRIVTALVKREICWNVQHSALWISRMSINRPLPP